MKPSGLRRNSFFSFQFLGRKDKISGVVLDYNDHFTLIRRCDDYRPECYTIFQNKNVKLLSGEFEKRSARILKLKGYSPEKEPIVPLDNLENIFSFIDKHYKLVQIDTRDGLACDVLKYNGMKNERYLFDALNTNAKWSYKLELPEKECRVFHFDNDYVNSLLLITKFKKRVSQKN